MVELEDQAHIKKLGDLTMSGKYLCCMKPNEKIKQLRYEALPVRTFKYTAATGKGQLKQLNRAELRRLQAIQARQQAASPDGGELKCWV